MRQTAANANGQTDVDGIGNHWKWHHPDPTLAAAACPGLLTNRILEAATVSGGSRGSEAL